MSLRGPALEAAPGGCRCRPTWASDFEWDMRAAGPRVLRLMLPLLLVALLPVPSGGSRPTTRPWSTRPGGRLLPGLNRSVPSTEGRHRRGESMEEWLRRLLMPATILFTLCRAAAAGMLVGESRNDRTAPRFCLE